MQKYILGLTRCCVENGIVKEEDADWFRYGVEKRISTIGVGIPFFLLAAILTNFATSCTLYISFFILRTKTNGFHAKTIIGCLSISLLAEVGICVLLFPALNEVYRLLLCSICVVVVFKLAPFIHDNLPLSSAEIICLRKESRSRICLLAIAALCTQHGQLVDISNGLTLGITMATTMLCFPHIIRKVKSTWKK